MIPDWVRQTRDDKFVGVVRLGLGILFVMTGAMKLVVPMLAEAFCRAGATRVTSFEKAPWPPPWWHHDGASVLAGLIRWIDLEEIG